MSVAARCLKKLQLATSYSYIALIRKVIFIPLKPLAM